MGNLKHIQNQLLDDIFSVIPSQQFDARGLNIYRANLRATASRALSISFPTVHQMLGEQAFSMVAERLLQFSPPHQGDWAVWGVALPDLISGLPELEDYPFLADCARLDYHCHQIVRCPFIAPNIDSLKLMQSHHPEELFLVLNPSLLLIQSEFPIADIRHAHQQAGETLAALQQVVRRMGDQNYVACYLNHEQVRLQPLTAVEFAWLNALSTQSLGAVLTEFKNTELSFEIWLTEAVENNLFNEINYQPQNEE